MLTEVVNISEVKLRKVIKKAFRNWVHTFGEECNEKTRLSNLSYETIKRLAICRDDTGFYIYDLIMNLLEIGSGMGFYDLEGDSRLKVLDIYLFLLDRIRFEAMKRLKWIVSYPGEDIPIVDMVLKYDEIHRSIERSTPVLSKDHMSYEDYVYASDYDREGIVRRLIPEMIKNFEKKE